MNRWKNRERSLPHRQGAYAPVREQPAAALAQVRTLSDHQGMALALNNLRLVAFQQGDGAAARAHFAAMLQQFAAPGDARGMRPVCSHLVLVAMHHGTQAELEQALVLFEAQGDLPGIALVRGKLGIVAVAQGNRAVVRAQLTAALRASLRLGTRMLGTEALAYLGVLAVAEHQPERAAQLLGAATVLRYVGRGVFDPADQTCIDQWVTMVRADIGDEAFMAVWKAGQALSWEGMVAAVLTGPPVPVSDHLPPSTLRRSPASAGSHRIPCRPEPLEELAVG